MSKEHFGKNHSKNYSAVYKIKDKIRCCMIIKFNNKLFELIIKYRKKKKKFLNDPRSRNKQVAYHVRGYGMFI